MTDTLELKIEQIKRNPKQPRKRFTPATLNELAQSIKEQGIIHPVLVEPDGKGYILVDGERRWRASKLAGLKTIPAIVRAATNHNGQARLLTGLIANIQREDMNAIDEAEAYLALRDEYGMEKHEIALKLGKSVTHVHNVLRRMELDPEVRETMRDGRISADPRVVAALLSLPGKHTQRIVARNAAEKKLAIRSILDTVERTKKALEARDERFETGKTPSLQISRMRAGLKMYDEKGIPPKWTALLQIGKVPPWNVVINAAQDTCAVCELRSMANRETCGRCPLVEVLTKMMEAGS